MKLTISDIHAATSEKSPHFFDRATLRFFGQRKGSFRVWKGKSGAHYIAAPIRREDRYTGRSYAMGLTFRKFTGDDLTLVDHPEFLGTDDAKEWVKQNG